MVRLLQAVLIRLASNPASFNPTMVRLLRFNPFLAFGAVVGFQSHNGAIAAPPPTPLITRQQVSIPQWCDCCHLSQTADQLWTNVSIPQWCDCCMQHSFRVQGGQFVSIPQWCDCCLSQIVGQFVRQVCFNPTMVRLLPSPINRATSLPPRFNPTMVRLLQKR